jgi:mono/diheme cytochrome c family protein
MLAGAGLALVTGALFAVQRPAAKAAAPPSDRGAYIVEHLSRCGQCHTPRDESGNLVMTRMLSGAPIPLRSPFPDRPWAFAAPNIRGLAGYTDEEAIRLLTEGVTRGGTPPQLPMQEFGMNREDAAAVVAYLRSLK